MRRRIILLMLLILAFSLPAAGAEIGPFAKETAEADGRRIFDIAKEFNRPKRDIVVYASMTLKSGETVSDTRKVIIKEKTDGELSRAVFRFIDSMKRGLTFLTIETSGPNNDQYLYTPAIGRPRQIASQDRQNNFEDTDLTNEDLGGLKLDDYAYSRGNDATVEGRACFKVTATAKAAEARFPKRISWIDQQ
ncbi:MAG: outer membrane lipoprotein-sorting protein, partial [Desulfatitalea sp.]|nr:outer membrane lipoprotein-sorting protein [Desulfatitalea sp.]